MKWSLDCMALTSMAIPSLLGWREKRESKCKNNTKTELLTILLQDIVVD